MRASIDITPTYSYLVYTIIMLVLSPCCDMHSVWACLYKVQVLCDCMSAQAAENVSQLNIGAKYCILTHALCDVCLVSLTCVCLFWVGICGM